ncbi:MAG: DUF1854 domain-containing protein [Oscillospiraceae bacterium]|nr:DUF1854 domain-containing protein [Oscillospiraceae bacterium]
MIRTIEKIPGFLAEALQERGIAKDDILLCVKTDMTAEREFAVGYLCAMPERLMYLQFETQQDVMALGDYYLKKHSRLDRIEHYEDINLTDFEEATLKPALVGGSFCLKTADQDYRIICGYSNERINSVKKFADLLGKLKKGEELTDADLHNPHEVKYCPKCGGRYPEQGRDICPKCINRRTIFMRIMDMFSIYKTRLVFIVILMLAEAGFALLMPYMTGRVFYDGVLARYGVFGGRIIAFTLLVAVISLCDHLSAIIRGRLMSKTMPTLIQDMRTKMFDSMQRLSISFYTKRQTGGLMQRLLQDTNDVFYFFVDFIPGLLVNLMYAVVSLVVMFRMDWRLGIIGSLGTPILFIMFKILFPRMFHVHASNRRQSGKLWSILNNNLTGARVVRAFGKEDHEKRTFGRGSQNLRETDSGIGVFHANVMIFHGFIDRLLFISLWGLGAYLVMQDNVTFGMLITFIGYIGTLNGAADFFAYSTFQWASSMSAAQRIFEVIDSVPEIRESENPIAMPEIKGDVELRDVEFEYEPNKPILKGMNLKIPAGRTLGIVGKSGAGKSTLVSLISRLYDTGRGEILIDGVNVKDISFDDMKRCVAMISQDSYMFIGSAAHNIAYAAPDSAPEEIIKAARVADAHNFILKLTDGYDTQLGSMGQELSGGQKQRISIARAILADPKILILDEATAAVDTQTELNIQQALDKITRGRTTLSIAHRLSTLRNADELVVIEKGEIVEQGTHKELLIKKGEYFNLVQLQNKSLSAMRGVSAMDEESKLQGLGEHEINYLTESDSRFEETEGGMLRLVYKDEGKIVYLYRSFPFTAPNEFISVRDDDGKEIGIIRDIRNLSGETAAAVSKALKARYFVPVITKIISVKEEYGYSYWYVGTDKGECRFVAQMGRASITLSPTRVMIRDLDGNRFEIPDTAALPVNELKKIELFL